MRPESERFRGAVVAALDREATKLKPTGNREWHLVLANGRPVGVDARLEERWLTVRATEEVSDHGEPPREPWELLELNGRLGGGARFALGPGEPRPRIRGEVALDDGIDAESRVRELCRGVRRGLAALESSSDDAETALPDVIEAEDSAPDAIPATEAWRELIRESGLGYREREGEALSLGLALPRDGFRATLGERAGCGALLGAQIAADVSSSALVRRALGLLLLRGSGAIRGVRGAAVERSAVRLEFDLGSRPVPAALDHGLAALAVACRMIGREARLLADRELARRYIELHGYTAKHDNVNDGNRREDR